jgi:hypothetical protein
MSAGIVDVFSGEAVNAADLSGDAAPAAWAQPDPPERTIGRYSYASCAVAVKNDVVIKGKVLATPS